MGIQIQNQFDVPLSLDAAFATLLDVPRVAACMPGAQLTRVIDDSHYEGGIDVKMGPMAFSFAGLIERTEADAGAHRMALRGDVKEKKARGHAQALVAVQLVAVGEVHTRVEIVSDITLGGQVAQYGRGAGMIKAVADEIVKRFAANLRAEIERSAVAAAQPAAVEGPASTSAPSAAAPLPAVASTVPPATSLSMGSVLWSVLLGWLRGLVGKKA